MRKPTTLFSLILICGLGVHLWAGAADVDLAETVLIGSRTPEALDRLDPSVGRISDSAISAMQRVDLVDALANEPGISAVRAGNRGAVASLFIRGSESNHTPILLQGRRLSPGFSGQYDVGLLSTSGLQSIEIMRGPSSSLYGPDAIGGVVDLRLPDPSRDDLRGFNGVLEAGSFNTLRSELQLITGGDSLGVALSASALDTDNDLANSDFRTVSTSPYIVYQLSERAVVELLTHYQDSKVGLPNARILPGFPEEQENRSEMLLLSPGIRIQGEDLWRAQVFYSHARSKLEARRTPSFGGLNSDNDFRNTLDQVEAQFDYMGWDDLTVSAGVSYLRYDYQRRPQPGSFATRFDDTTDNVGVFGQVVWEPSEEWRIAASGRFDYFSDYDNPVTGTLNIGRFFTATGTRIHTKIGTGFAPPTGNDLSFAFGDPNLEAEKSVSYEIGLAQELGQSNRTVSVVVFENRVRDLIQFNPVTFDPFNVGRTRARGAEFGLDWGFDAAWTLRANYTLLDAEVRSGPYLLGTETGGERLVRRPRHEGSVALLWNPELPLALGVESYFRRDVKDFDFNFPTSQVDLPSVVIWRLFGSYQLTENARFFGRVENLLDKDWEPTLGFPAPGRAFFAGLSVDL